MSRDVIVGVDVGGTFTDLFWLDAASGRFRTAKVPSRRGDEAVGFTNGLMALCEQDAGGSSAPSPRRGEGRGEGLSEPEFERRASLTRLASLATLSPSGRGKKNIYARAG